MTQALSVDDEAETLGTGGWCLGFRIYRLVRPDQAVEAEAGLLNLQRGWPRGWGADWQDLAWGSVWPN